MDCIDVQSIGRLIKFELPSFCKEFCKDALSAMDNDPTSDIIDIRKQGAEVKQSESVVAEMTPELAREIRDLSHQAIGRVSRLEDRPRESFVFRDDHFCGMRYRLGLFHAEWMTDSIEIRVFRDNGLVDCVPVPSLGRPVIRRAA